MRWLFCVMTSILLSILRILFGLLFMASAVLKLFPLDAFELVLIKQVGFSWALAPWGARLLILAEFALGAAIASGWWLRLSLRTSIAMVALFSIHLAYLAITGQGDENCGCFGELIPMDATTSLLKNGAFLLIGVVLLAMRSHASRLSLPIIGVLLTLAAIPTLFWYEPLPESQAGEAIEVDANMLTDLDEETGFSLTEDDKVVVVMYAKCVHCKQLASLLATTDANRANERTRLLIFGDEESVGAFIAETGLEAFRVGRTSSRPLMMAIDGTFPSVLQIHAGEVTAMWQGRDVHLPLLNHLIHSDQAESEP